VSTIRENRGRDGEGAREATPPDHFGRLLDAVLPARKTQRALEEKTERLEAFLRTVPVEYCGWDDKGAQAVSPGFLRLLGVAKVETPADVLAALSPSDAATLGALCDRLAKNNESFETGVHAPATGRALKLVGRRGAGGLIVLWALDVTDFAEAAMRGAEDVRAMEKRESDLRAALNALPFPLWLRGDSLDLSWCNRAYARSVDDTAAAVVADQRELPLKLPGGKSESRGESPPRVLAQRAMAKLTAQSARGHIVADGERRLVEVTEIPLPAERRGVGIALDVTKEEELVDAYQRLGKNQRDVLEQLRTAIAMFDQDTRVDFYNAAYEQLTGLSSTFLDTRPRMSEIIDKMRELRRLPEQADYKQYKQAWAARFTSLIEPHEEMMYLPDGTVVRMIVLPRPMSGIMVTLEDVTSRLKLETSYNTLMAVQQETLDNLSEGVAVFGEDGRLKLSNESWARMWNIPRDEVAVQGGPGPHITRLIERAKPFFPPAAWEGARQTLLENALEREPRRGRLHRAGGTVLEYSIVPLPDGNILNAWFDITDTVKVEQALMEKNAALEEAERLKTEFLANVSYQLRTPLNAIMGFAEMLNQQYFGKLNERQLEYTGSVIEAGQRLVSLVNDILDLSTIEAGYMRLYPTEVRIRDLMAQVLHLTGEWAKKQRIGAVIDCPDGALAVHADERRIKQVLLNLISNAINYSPGGGTITLSARRDGDYVVVGVKDTGLGIAEDDLSRVFTPFERIRTGKAQRRSGAGLGLALVKSIVQLHGGNVTIESREGLGTTVSFRLPVTTAE
jgi:signal transduction histidine kinase